MRIRRFTVAGTGIHLPEWLVTSLDLDRIHGRHDGWTESKSGVKSRRFVGPGETTSSMAASAARAALDRAGLRPLELDCIVSACGVGEQAIPCTAVLVQKALGLENSKVPAFDVGSTCLSFLTALDVVSSLIDVGRFARVLVVSSDIPSPGLDWDHPESSLIFGDGAAAAVLTALPGKGLVASVIASHMETFSSASEACRVLAGGTLHHPMRSGADLGPLSLFEMDGKAAYRISSENIGGFMDRLLEQASIRIEDIDVVVPHQASLLALHHLRRKLGIPEHKVIDIFATFGNQVAASMPTALHHAIASDAIRPGNKVLMIGTGAGISLAGMVLEFS